MGSNWQRAASNQSNHPTFRHLRAKGSGTHNVRAQQNTAGPSTGMRSATPRCATAALRGDPESAHPRWGRHLGRNPCFQNRIPVVERPHMKRIVPAAVFLLMVSVGMSLRPRDVVAELRRMEWQHGAGLVPATFMVPAGTSITAGAHPAAATGENGGRVFRGAAPGLVDTEYRQARFRHATGGGVPAVGRLADADRPAGSADVVAAAGSNAARAGVGAGHQPACRGATCCW